MVPLLALGTFDPLFAVHVSVVGCGEVNLEAKVAHLVFGGQGVACRTKSYLWNSTELEFQKLNFATVIGLTLAKLIETNLLRSRGRVGPGADGRWRLRLNKLRGTILSIGIVGLLFEVAIWVLLSVPFFCCRGLFFEWLELLLADSADVMEQSASVLVG